MDPAEQERYRDAWRRLRELSPEEREEMFGLVPD